jgi:hypothetical protein
VSDEVGQPEKYLNEVKPEQPLRSKNTNVHPHGALLYYYSSSIVLVLYNKWMFVKFGLKYPLSVTSVHMVTSFVFAFSVQRFRRGRWEIGVSSGAMKKCIVVGLFVGADVGLTNSSFLYVSVPFIEMVKSICPLWVLMLSLLLGIEKFSFYLIGVVAAMSAGLALSVRPASPRTASPQRP